ncbi:MAG: hypothetical protein HY728_01515 [Candidatus Rokubacteria bacterium]|nr:hypothetical protein [Candidatus Rokubacteria bacterium]
MGRPGPAWAAAVAILVSLGGPARLAAEESKAGLSLQDLGLSGKVIYKNFSHFYDVQRDGNFRDELILQPEWRHKLGSRGSVLLIADIRDDDWTIVHGLHERFPDTREHRSAISVKELVLAADLAPVRLTAGKQIFNWGTGDGYNPTDNINPYDYLDPIDREKIAVWSAAATATFAEAQVQFVIVPLFTPARDPQASGRWVEEREGGDDTFGGNLPTGSLLRKRQVPGTDFDAIQYAARVKTTQRGWDVSLSYYDGFEPTPVLRHAGRSQFDIVFEPVYTRVKVPGADFSTTWRKFEFHGEAVARFEERRGKSDRFHGLGGFNYTWDELGVKWLDHLQLILEYSRETNLTSRSRSQFRESSGFTTAFRDALLGRFQIKFNEETQFAVSGNMDFVRDPNYYVQFKLTHKFTDAVKLEAGLDFFDGLRGTFWGVWRNNDRFFASLRYLF